MSTITASRIPQPAAYGEQARSYDQSTGAYQNFRKEIVDALPVQRGDVVLDVGCGTGLCFQSLLAKVGPEGAVVGVDASSEMTAVARERVAHEGWDNVIVLNASASEVELPEPADAALFCAVHDVLRSPAALRQVVDQLRPGATVVAGGGKWAAPWMVALNLHVLAVHSPYVRSFEGFDRPWSHLEDLVEEVQVRGLALGSGYVASGRVPITRGR